MPNSTKGPRYGGWKETDIERQENLTEESVMERQEDKRKKKGTETEKRGGERDEQKETETVRGRPPDPEQDTVELPRWGAGRVFPTHHAGRVPFSLLQRPRSPILGPSPGKFLTFPLLLDVDCRAPPTFVHPSV